MEILIRECNESDIEILKRISYETYDETFRKMNTAETMNLYLQAAFNNEKLLNELSTPGSRFYLLYADNNLAGYLKVNEGPAQSDINDPDSLEIERIYVKQSYKGSGLGTYLINYALKLAIMSGKRYAWLGVWEKNIGAISFYKKMGFTQFGKHSFKMGNELQSDLILRKTLTS